MRKTIFSIFCITLSVYSSFAQQFTESNLPIILINTDGGVNIPDGPRVLGHMKIIFKGPGERNYLSDQNDIAALNYNGRIDIETRGSSSQLLNKKQYGFSTKKADNVSNSNVPLLGMPSENDWILNGLAYDSSYIRDYLSYNLSRKMGNYASRTAYCELVLNGSYKGLYVLQEKIKVDDRRVDIAKMDSTDVAGPKSTGGYITKIDKATGTGSVAWRRSSAFGTNDLNFIHEFPDFDEITPSQHRYIQSVFDKLDSTAQSQNTSITKGYPSIIDIPSFVDYMLINELGSNADAYQNSTFFHKERRGKLRAGPAWDMNLTYGNDLPSWKFKRSQPNVWQFANGDNEGSKFWKNLYNEPLFRCYMAKRWKALTQPGQAMYLPNIEAFIDTTVHTISEAVEREKALWNSTKDHSKEIDKIKGFIEKRIEWMTQTLGSSSVCDQIQLPALTITKIMYHPFGSEKEEFIEITNTGDTSVPLAGMYFSNLGFGYQFPWEEVLEAHKTYIIASDDSTFEAIYGFAPNGEFARNLSNAGQSIVLADAFGNVIDQVDYADTAPWPDADGTGAFLALKEPSLDNNVGSNWGAENGITLSLSKESLKSQASLYPNPTYGLVQIKVSGKLENILVYDLHGKNVPMEGLLLNGNTLDLSTLEKGTYMIKCVTQDESIIQKIIRQ